MDGAVIYHKELAKSGRWAEMPFAQQMANIGSEVFRAGKWKDKGNADLAQHAADRALELLDFTIDARVKKRKSLRELLRLREVLCDFFYGDNEYSSSVTALNRYFDPFSMEAARQRQR